MRPVAYVAPGESTSRQWTAAFARGCGGVVQTGGRLDDGPVALFGSPQLEPMLAKVRRLGRTWYYGDHAYFGRKTFFRCTKNALQHDGLSGDSDPRRFRSFGIPVRDWRSSGSHVVLCPNSESFLGRHGAPGWIDETMATLRRHTDRRIVLRWKTHVADRPLAIDLRNAWAVVTFSSNAAVEAVLAGIPAFCTAACAALAMGEDDLSKIESPRLPDGREAWAARLANNQWTLDEMKSGELWRAIGGA